MCDRILTFKDLSSFGLIFYFYYFRADVTVTDLPSVLPLLERNIAVNKAVWSKTNGHVKVKKLCWGESNETLDPPNLLLLADCVYYTEVQYNHDICLFDLFFLLIEN